MGKPNISKMAVEAYALPCTYYLPDTAHCFVVSLDRRICWRNYGRGWDDGGSRTNIANNQSYKEWLLEFVPQDNLSKCGINFGVNGVCHTFANRELLIGENNVDVHLSAKDYACVFFFGKYGIGLNKLKEILRQSYQQVTRDYNDPYGALNQVLQRVDNYLEDELRAWRLVAIEYGKIPVDAILAKNPVGGLNEASRRLQALINERESLYQQNLDGKISAVEFKRKYNDLIQMRTDDYLNMLRSINYITESERSMYSNNIKAFLHGFQRSVDLQMEEILKNGVMWSLDMELV